jgi:hypothetical protein
MNNQANVLNCHRIIRGVLSAAAILGLFLALDAVGVSVFSVQVAQAETGMTELEEKAGWQQRYRTLLQLQTRLRDDASTARENYARAQRRNYPRGGARQQFIVDAEEAEAQLVTARAETETLLEQARHNAIPRNWFYEVDDEDIQSTSPAATGANEDAEDDSREGRNPLYLD